MNPPPFPCLAEHGRTAVAQIAALSATDGEPCRSGIYARQFPYD
ncbi:MAG: hypothetical protein Q3966_07255 [Neisseria sp.]|nr:hypothetical protein [Neisseria sp.]